MNLEMLEVHGMMMSYDVRVYLMIVSCKYETVS